MKNTVKVFKALSDSNRLRILNMLKEHDLCVCELQYVLGLAMSTVSKHLSILNDAEFIESEKQGKWVVYSLIDDTNNFRHCLTSAMFEELSDDATRKEDLEKLKTFEKTDDKNKLFCL